MATRGERASPDVIERGIAVSDQQGNTESALQPGPPLGQFELLEELGRGGMGVVFRARDQRLQRDVALKAMLPRHKEDREAVQRFLREARMAAKVSHVNIATIYEIDEDEGNATERDTITCNRPCPTTVCDYDTNCGDGVQDDFGNINIDKCNCNQVTIYGCPGDPKDSLPTPVYCRPSDE